MWKLLKSLPSAFVVALIVAAIASAAPSPHPGAHDPSPTGVTAPEGSTGLDTEPVATEPVETEPTSDAEDSTADEGGTAPDFSPCVDLTGLDNAICRHEQLLAVHPDNEGLANSLSHLQDNKANHDSETETGSTQGGVTSGETGPDSTGPGNGHGSANGHGNAGGTTHGNNGNGNG